MRPLGDGWYVTSAQGPVTLHVPDVVVDIPDIPAWMPQSRPKAPPPVERPERPDGPGFRPEYVEDRAAALPAPAWVSRDGGQTYVQIAGGRPVAVQYSGVGQMTGGKVRQNAETFTWSWIRLISPPLPPATPENPTPTSYLWEENRAPNGVPIPCELDPEQPTHVARWQPLQGPGSMTFLRLDRDAAYGHVEWIHRANPTCYPVFLREKGIWYWRDPVGRLYPTPANKPGQLLITPIPR